MSTAIAAATARTVVRDGFGIRNFSYQKSRPGKPIFRLCRDGCPNRACRASGWLSPPRRCSFLWDGRESALLIWCRAPAFSGSSSSLLGGGRVQSAHSRLRLMKSRCGSPMLIDSRRTERGCPKERYGMMADTRSRRSALAIAMLIGAFDALRLCPIADLRVAAESMGGAQPQGRRARRRLCECGAAPDRRRCSALAPMRARSAATTGVS